MESGKGIVAFKNSKRIKSLALELESLYSLYHRKELMLRDPLGLVNSQLNPNDFELVSFVSAGLSYGRVEQIQKSLTELWKKLEYLGLDKGGGGLSIYLLNNPWKTLEKDIQLALKGWVHRFNKSDDIVTLFHVFKNVYSKYESLGALYSSSSSDDSEIKINQFCLNLRNSVASVEERERVRWFSCAPHEGSTCKRLMMWLRWVLRSDDIDPGLWTLKKVKLYSNVAPHEAFIPMDTHVHRWASKRKLLSSKNPSWKAVREFTNILREVDSEDPIRFDFSICHQGMDSFRQGRVSALS
jgi:uncharacterized protein (TIGR02757 family)